MSHLFNAFHTREINVFFDESGKGDDRPNLLGSLSIPKKIYEQDDIQYMNYFLKKKIFKIHWKNYNGNEFAKENILNLIDIFIMYKEFIKLNVINYHYGFLKGQELFSKKDRDETIYSKFPERLIYGLIRGYGGDMRVSANIYIDKSTEYETLELDKTLISTLNSHSLYRGEKFYAKECYMFPKNSEIGLELTDVLLGLIRTIIRNPTINDKTSKIEQAKVRLTIELLKNPEFKEILSNIKYYEWRGNKELSFIHFSDYISAFLVKQTW
ncbi:hypothetical protein P4S75_10430 [Anoxybacillus ayderensis]|uniref:DUF3800 domain-containing protein n=1 Tax=Anoxybacillus ayderensis TaxID=265546 RepID=UPI002E1DAEC2|nr:hypothetical protein [Anoxybacillus ayderensis]